MLMTEMKCDIKDINLAFEKDLGNNFKTVMKWSI